MMFFSSRHQLCFAAALRLIRFTWLQCRCYSCCACACCLNLLPSLICCRHQDLANDFYDCYSCRENWGFFRSFPSDWWCNFAQPNPWWWNDHEGSCSDLHQLYLLVFLDLLFWGGRERQAATNKTILSATHAIMTRSVDQVVETDLTFDPLHAVIFCPLASHRYSCQTDDFLSNCFHKCGARVAWKSYM